MPELPEVETILQRLLTVLPGKQVQAVEVLRSKSFIGEPARLVGAIVTSIERRSKILIFSFDRPEKLLVHLKMTGQLIYVDATTRLGGGHPTADWIQTLPSSHTRVAITLSEGAQLFFNDQRVFGWLKVVDQAGVHAEFATLGPDITESSVTSDYFFNGIKKRSVPIKQLIMENSFVAGVGNIYANDALHAAGIDPFQPACALKRQDSDRLLDALKTVVQLVSAWVGQQLTTSGILMAFQEIIKRLSGFTAKKVVRAGFVVMKSSEKSWVGEVPFFVQPAKVRCIA